MPPLPASFNSLFWRLFCGLIAVILATAAAVWTAAYVVQSQVVAKLENSLSLRYGGQRAVETAFIMHRYAGEAGLVEWLLSDANQRPTVFVMTKTGVELSGRTVPERARQLLEDLQSGKVPDARGEGFPSEAVKTVEIGGKPYFIFAVHTSLPPRAAQSFPLQQPYTGAYSHRFSTFTHALRRVASRALLFASPASTRRSDAESG